VRITAAMCAAGRTIGEPRLAPVGALVAFVVTVGGRGALVVLDLEGGHEQVVTTDPAPQGARAYGGGTFDWVPDGSGLVYAGADGGLWHQPVVGGPPRQLVAGATGPCAAPAVSPDGASVAYVVDQRHVAVVGTAPDAPWPRRLSGAATSPSIRVVAGRVDRGRGTSGRSRPCRGTPAPISAAPADGSGPAR
jgi:Tol biopolymer transport system component